MVMFQMNETFKAILDHVVFQFEDGVHNGQFTEQKIGSLIMAGMGKNHVRDGELSRWAIIRGIGKDVTSVKVGERVFIDKHRWTNGFKVGDETFWRTNEKSILAVDE